MTFGTTRVVGRQPHAPAAFTPGEIHGTHFRRLSRPQGTWFRRGEPPKKSPVTPPGIDPGTVQLVAQCLNHYGRPGPPLPCVLGRIFMNLEPVTMKATRSLDTSGNSQQRSVLECKMRIDGQSVMDGQHVTKYRTQTCMSELQRNYVANVLPTIT